MSAPYPPQAVGRAAGLPIPARLPMIGTAVVDPGGVEGRVAHYEFHDPDQQWFPVSFMVLTCAVTRRRRLGKNANLGGYVRLADRPKVTPLDTARKPVPKQRTSDDVAQHVAAG